MRAARHEIKRLPGGSVETVELRPLDVEEVTFRYLASRAPVDVLTPLLAAPADVRVTQARNRTTQRLESGARVTWTWRGGTIQVHAIDVSDTAVEHDVTLRLER